MASVLDLVGNTPMVEIKKLNPNPNVKIYAKLEGNNPGGSVKDRPALNMIRSAIERGDIKPGMKLIEATSGNTGIALAMIACLTESWLNESVLSLSVNKISGQVYLYSGLLKNDPFRTELTWDTLNVAAKFIAQSTSRL